RVPRMLVLLADRLDEANRLQHAGLLGAADEVLELDLVLEVVLPRLRPGSEARVVIERLVVELEVGVGTVRIDRGREVIRIRAGRAVPVCPAGRADVAVGV